MPAYSPCFEMPNARCSSSHGFSLVELLAVLALIVTLVGFTLGLTTGVFSRKAETRAISDLATLSQALERYRAKAQDYPWVGTAPLLGSRPNPAGGTALLRTLLGYRSVDPARPHLIVQGDFLPVDQFDFGDRSFEPGEDPGTAYLQDPWGNPYVYVYNPSYPKSESQWRHPGYLLLTAGPDGELSLPGEVQTTGIIDSPLYESNPVNADNLVFQR